MSRLRCYPCAMLKVLSFVAVLSLVFFGSWLFIPHFEVHARTVLDAVDYWAYDKDVEFSGLKLLDENSLKKSLPMDLTTFNWVLNTDRIEQILKSNPLVRDVKMEMCENKARNCFRFLIKEGHPYAIIKLQDSFWLVDKKGVFLSPVRPNHPRSLLELPLISGVDVAFASPEFVRGRTTYTLGAIEKIQEASGREVERIVIEDNGELKVKFRGSDYTAVFSDEGKRDYKRVLEGVERFKALSNYLEGKEVLVEELDFAFNSQCVVKLTEQGRKIMKL